MDTLLGAHSFFMEGWGEGLYLDQEKWAEKARGIDEVIKREEIHAKGDLKPEEEEKAGRVSAISFGQSAEQRERQRNNPAEVIPIIC